MKMHSHLKELLEAINNEKGIHYMSSSAEKPFVQNDSSNAKSPIAKEAKATESSS